MKAINRMRGLAAAVLFSTLLAGLLWSAEPANDVITRRANFQKEVARLRNEFASKLPDDAFLRGPDGEITGVNKNHPEYRRLQAEYESGLETAWQRANQGDARFDELQEICREAGIEQGIKNTGSRPKSINSDMDVTETSPGAGKKLANALGKKGYTVRELPDRWVVSETDTTIWKQGSVERAGSAAHQAQQASHANAEDIFPTEGGKYRTSNGKVGVSDPEGAVLSNAKKFSEATRPSSTSHGGTTRPDLPPDVQNIDGHTAGKSVSKAAEWTGSKHRDPEFFKKADALRQHKSWEDAGVCDHGDPPEVKARKIREFIQKGKEYLGEAADVARTQSRQLDQTRKKVAESYDKQGLREEAMQVREKSIRARVSNQETMRNLVQNDPELAGRMRGMKIQRNPDGTFTELNTGKRMTPSQLEEAVTQPSRAKTIESVRETVEPTAKVPGEGVSPVRTAATKWGARGIIIYMAYEGAKQGAEQAVAEEKAGDSGLYTWGKATVYGIRYASGFQFLSDIAAKAGEDTAIQFEKDRKAGKNPSEAWAETSATGLAVTRLVKALTIDLLAQGAVAVKQGAGAAVDTVSAQQKEQASKDFLRRVRARKERLARAKEGAEKRLSRIELTKNWVRMKNVPLVRGGDWLTAESDNAQLERDNPDEYKHRIALILEQYDRLRDKLKKDGIPLGDKNAERKLIYNLLWTKRRHPEDFEKQLSDLYATFGKTYAVLATAEDLSGHWSGGEFVVAEAHFNEAVLKELEQMAKEMAQGYAGGEGCDPGQVEEAKKNVQKDLPKKFGLTFDLRATSATTGAADFKPIGGAAKDGLQSLNLSYKYGDGQITLDGTQSPQKGVSYVIHMVGSVQRTGDAWLMAGAWTIAVKAKGKTFMLVKGTWSGKKAVSKR